MSRRLGFGFGTWPPSTSINVNLVLASLGVTSFAPSASTSQSDPAGPFAGTSTTPPIPENLSLVGSPGAFSAQLEWDALPAADGDEVFDQGEGIEGGGFRAYFTTDGTTPTLNSSFFWLGSVEQAPGRNLTTALLETLPPASTIKVGIITLGGFNDTLGLSNIIEFQTAAAPAPTTWYVDPDVADGGDGSIGDPFRFPQDAIDVAQPGDTIVLMAGIYTDAHSLVPMPQNQAGDAGDYILAIQNHDAITVRHGSPGYPIRIVAQDGFDSVIFRGGFDADGRQTNQTQRLNVNVAKSYWDIEGIHVRGGGCLISNSGNSGTPLGKDVQYVNIVDSKFGETYFNFGNSGILFVAGLTDQGTNSPVPETAPRNITFRRVKAGTAWCSNDSGNTTAVEWHQGVDIEHHPVCGIYKPSGQILFDDCDLYECPSLIYQKWYGRGPVIWRNCRINKLRALGNFRGGRMRLENSILKYFTQTDIQIDDGGTVVPDHKEPKLWRYTGNVFDLAPWPSASGSGGNSTTPAIQSAPGNVSSVQHPFNYPDPNDAVCRCNIVLASAVGTSLHDLNVDADDNLYIWNTSFSIEGTTFSNYQSGGREPNSALYTGVTGGDQEQWRYQVFGSPDNWDYSLMGAAADAKPTCGLGEASMLTFDAANPRWLFYEDGTPMFIMGSGDPEGFLYLPLATQKSIILALRDAGCNAMYMQLIRRASWGGDGTDSESPFNTTSNPASGLNTTLINQWDDLFSMMDSAGIAPLVFFYDDGGAAPFSWDQTSTDLGNPATVGTEAWFITNIVGAFKHHRNIIWVSAEEYTEGNRTTAHAQAMADLVRDQYTGDPFAHPMSHHQLPGLVFDFPNANAAEVFQVQRNVGGVYNPTTLHNDAVTAWNTSAGRYVVNFSEITSGSTKHGSLPVQDQRRINWAVIMGGAYVQVIDWWVNANPPNQSALDQAGYLCKFMNDTRFDLMEPADARIAGDTLYAMAHRSTLGNDYFIGYAISVTSGIGFTSVDAGTYDLIWMDTISGVREYQRRVVSSSGSHTFSKPAWMSSTELVLYVKKVF